MAIVDSSGSLLCSASGTLKLSSGDLWIHSQSWANPASRANILWKWNFLKAPLRILRWRELGRWNQTAWEAGRWLDTEVISGPHEGLGFPNTSNFLTGAWSCSLSNVSSPQWPSPWSRTYQSPCYESVAIASWLPRHGWNMWSLMCIQCWGEGLEHWMWGTVLPFSSTANPSHPREQSEAIK